MNSGIITPISKVIKNIVDNWALSNLETLDIAIVVDASKYGERLVSVLPLCIQEDPDGIAPEKPLIHDCPVVLQGNVDGFAHFPLRKGDKVLIGYPKDSIEEFIYSTSTSQYFQVDSMKFQGSQAVVLGAIGQPALDRPLSTTDFETVYYNSRIRITPEDTIQISTPSGLIEIDSEGFIGLTNPNGTITLQSDGSASVSNSSGNITLGTSGEIDANGCTITTDGNVITAAGADVDEIRSQLDSFKAAYELHGAGASNHPPPSPY